ncbi:SDR family NAD(P)-dependent oxidoreductase [Nocardia sp. alder85J]|uniref:SDR family NAD(P)-dependent oxidoreductase n=1 Tax=Nocardia sp. alder85J TaxID=2862949 RepID=UPI001CD27D46|nr:SDR family oxidoreductase [Nocardia sp. alder85J]MCX4095762.1 SDR family NAD(P)-dependent oxidoreductase [Nocardia sp. alder85J]
MSKRFGECIALITGSGSGIGRASAVLLAREGAVVVVNDISEKSAEVTANLIRETGGEAHVIAGDVTVPNFVDEMFDDVVDRYGRVDVVHNNVGFGGRNSIVDTDDESWRHGLDGNLGATFRGIRAAVRVMAPRRRGAIVNTASAAGTRKVPGVVPYYGTAKAGVIQLTREAAVEAGEFGIRVNAVVPGSVRTPAFESYLGAYRFQRYVAQLPLHRMAEPEDIAHAVAFLASAEAAAITGIALPVDSGVGAVLYQPVMDQ